MTSRVFMRLGEGKLGRGEKSGVHKEKAFHTVSSVDKRPEVGTSVAAGIQLFQLRTTVLPGETFPHVLTLNIGQNPITCSPSPTSSVSAAFVLVRLAPLFV